MINFHTEEIDFKVQTPIKTKRWLKKVIEMEGFELSEINYIFCSDEYLLQINQEYLKHNTYTDIITFDYTENELLLKKRVGGISGDIFISIDRVAENAKKFSKTFENELYRVMIHGVLHLLGYTDKTKNTKEEMTKQEDLCLKALNKFLV